MNTKGHALSINRLKYKTFCTYPSIAPDFRKIIILFEGFQAQPLVIPIVP
jgi:hypothetical protein